MTRKYVPIVALVVVTLVVVIIMSIYGKDVQKRKKRLTVKTVLTDPTKLESKEESITVVVNGNPLTTPFTIETESESVVIEYPTSVGDYTYNSTRYVGCSGTSCGRGCSSVAIVSEEATVELIYSKPGGSTVSNISGTQQAITVGERVVE